MNIVFKKESFEIVGACFEVHNQMGAGFLESVYQECLSIEFANRTIPVTSQPRLEINYKGTTLESKFVPDFICYGHIIVEIKAVSEVTDIHRAQVHNYLKATGHKLGLLINFNSHPKLQHERIVR